MLVWAAFLALLWQSPVPPAPAPAAPPVAPAPEKPVFTSQGKPIVLNAPCGSAEMELFGLDCHADEPCPLFLDLTSVDAAGSRIFLAGNLHTESATIFGLLLVSEDDGRRWTDATARLSGAALDALQFVDFQNGYVSGHAAGALLKDPFFLKTRDGGKTWEKLDVFDESAVGIIENFWFESATQGAMVVDRMQAGTKAGRWQRYETMTGAGTWMLREVTPRAPVVKRGKNELWRLRTDGPARAYRVEKRDGAQWKTVASFAIHSGHCKPDPPPPPIEP